MTFYCLFSHISFLSCDSASARGKSTRNPMNGPVGFLKSREACHAFMHDSRCLDVLAKKPSGATICNPNTTFLLLPFPSCKKKKISLHLARLDSPHLHHRPPPLPFYLTENHCSKPSRQINPISISKSYKLQSTPSFRVTYQCSSSSHFH